MRRLKRLLLVPYLLRPCSRGLLPEGEGILLFTTALIIMLNIFSIQSGPSPKGEGFTDPLYGDSKPLNRTGDGAACVSDTYFNPQNINRNVS